MLVPGLGCDDDLYAEQVRSLRDVVRPVVPDITPAATVAAMGQAVLDAAPPMFTLLGLSLGGYVALEVLRAAPERVEALALLDTSARPEQPEQTARRRALLALADEQGYDAALEVLWPLEVAPSRAADEALHARFRAMMTRTGEEVFRRQTRAIVERPDSRPDLPGVAVPTLVLCGRDDRITPLDGHEELAAGIPGAELVVLDDCGHLSSWERPDDVDRAVRGWLAR